MGAFGVVYDTNTFVSAYGFGGTPEDALKIGFYEDVDVFTSPPVTAEYQRVLTYEGLPFDEEERRELVPEFMRLAGVTAVDETPDLQVANEDPDDDKFVELAVASDADFLVSGDDDLRTVGHYAGTEILDSAEFLEAVDRSPPDSRLRS